MEKKNLIIAIDAMGGDNAPGEIVLGALDALKKSPRISLKLVGKKEAIEAVLAENEYEKSRIEIVDASEVIDMNEAPVEAIRHKKDSSMVKGFNILKSGEADAFVSAGSTGAVLAGGQLIVGRIRGVERTPIGVVFPTAGGLSLLIDSGANMDAKPGNILQFAIMGSIYMSSVLGKDKPTVGLVNVGVEEEKGNAQTKEAYALLKDCKDINFIGNVEAREIPKGVVDVVVCDAFVGNVILKLYEGTASALIGIIKGSLMTNLRSKIGGLLIKPALKGTLKTLDASEYGGAPLLGLRSLVVKAHGNSKRKEMCIAILQTIGFYDDDIVGKVTESLGNKKESTEE